MGYLFKSKTWSYFDILYLNLNLYKYFTDLSFQLVTAHWIWYAENLKAFMSRLLVLLSNFSFTCLSWLLSKFLETSTPTWTLLQLCFRSWITFTNKSIHLLRWFLLQIDWFRINWFIEHRFKTNSNLRFNGSPHADTILELSTDPGKA